MAKDAGVCEPYDLCEDEQRAFLLGACLEMRMMKKVEKVLSVTHHQIKKLKKGEEN